jgi:predicted SAM-dependent methyltransferase
MKYLNLGCGEYYSTQPEWINIDFYSDKRGVISHNLIKGIPFNDNTFDLVYHSHVLEHFTKKAGQDFINECLRVLKPGGIIRIAVPDLERIVTEYLRKMGNAIENPLDSKCEADYDWIMLELLDQTVRNQSGGNMADYLKQEKIINEDFVYRRIGYEGRNIRNSFIDSLTKPSRSLKNRLINFNVVRVANLLNRKLYESFIIPEQCKIGKFRLSGEIHLWMYDRYSLFKLLEKSGYKGIIIRDALTSYIKNWNEYSLDVINCEIRKPDSLFMEAMK